MQLAKRLPLDEPDNLDKLRMGYVAAQLVAVGIYLYIQQKASLIDICQSSVILLSVSAC